MPKICWQSDLHGNMNFNIGKTIIYIDTDKTDRHTHRQTLQFIVDLETESAQWANSVKIAIISETSSQ